MGVFAKYSRDYLYGHLVLIQNISWCSMLTVGGNRKFRSPSSDLEVFKTMLQNFMQGRLADEVQNDNDQHSTTKI